MPTIRNSLITLTAAMVLAAGAGWSYQPKSKSSGSGDAKWPEYKQKELYADDFRGKPAPDFKIEKYLTKEPDTKGKVVMVDFWATWCGPCRASIPELNDFQKQFKDDLVIIGLSDEPVSKIKPFMSKTKMNYTVATDTKGAMKKQVNVRGIPHAMVISTDGVVRWQGLPGMPDDKLTAKVLKQIIDADPGVKARREGKKSPAPKAGGESSGSSSSGS